MTRKGTDYVPAPEIVQADLLRYQTALGVLAGVIQMTEGARRLGLSRMRFQTLVHRAQRAFVDALIPHPGGRPPKPEREVELESRVAQLERENKALSEQLAWAQNLFGAAGEMLRSVREPRRREHRAKAASTTKGSGEPEEPEPATGLPAKRSPSSTPRWPRSARAVWKEVLEMPLRGTRRLAALVLGVSLATLARWRAAGTPAPARSQRTEVAVDARAVLEAAIRETHGLIGAEALRHVAAGVSRRRAAEVKADVLTAIERERQARCSTVAVHAPGVIRGFDAMHVTTTEGPRYLLVATDGAVPFRTAADVVEHYDGPSVARSLEQDIVEHGAPLVYRLDRAACHMVDEVLELLEEHDVLALHGPPRHPGYYGQLERQNREHRAWLNALGPLSPAELATAVRRMRQALNAVWPRRTLGWRTSEGLWNSRPPITDDRRELRREVEERSARLRQEGLRPDIAQRYSIETALRRRGYLEIRTGGRC